MGEEVEREEKENEVGGAGGGGGGRFKDSKNLARERRSWPRHPQGSEKNGSLKREKKKSSGALFPGMNFETKGAKMSHF